jgi:SAM-dependent methyltransferase
MAMNTVRRRARRYRNLLALRRGRPADLHFYHADYAAARVPMRDARVLVVGCNTGAECRHFVGFGAGLVHGIDVVDTTGAEFSHPRVRYDRMSVEELGFADDSFDLVYAYATMEHVPDVDSAFAEMARVTKPGGVVYSQASPLWRSPYGHHKGDLFVAHPWIHLLMDADEILALCAREGISGGGDIEHHVRYMLNPAYFNMRPAADYVAACDALPQVELIENSLAMERPELLSDELEAQLAARGIGRDEALAVSHTLLARRMP